jgi:hypothetical protein
MKGLIANSGFQEKFYVAYFSILDGFCMIILPLAKVARKKKRLFHVQFVLKKIKKRGYFMCNLFLRKSNRQNFDTD